MPTEQPALDSPDFAAPSFQFADPVNGEVLPWLDRDWPQAPPCSQKRFQKPPVVFPRKTELMSTPEIRLDREGFRAVAQLNVEADGPEIPKVFETLSR